MDFAAQPKPAAALGGVGSADGKIAYPPGVKEITDKITTDEMIKRLKVSVVGAAGPPSPERGGRCPRGASTRLGLPEVHLRGFLRAHRLLHPLPTVLFSPGLSSFFCCFVCFFWLIFE